jgi:hypothetical protein
MASFARVSHLARTGSSTSAISRPASSPEIPWDSTEKANREGFQARLWDRRVANEQEVREPSTNADDLAKPVEVRQAIRRLVEPPHPSLGVFRKPQPRLGSPDRGGDLRSRRLSRLATAPEEFGRIALPLR